MKLSAILKANPDCTVIGYCRNCGHNAKASKLTKGLDGKALYACPNCGSINFRIDKVADMSQPWNTIILYERQE